jgi:hypothetical protein
VKFRFIFAAIVFVFFVKTLVSLYDYHHSLNEEVFVSSVKRLSKHLPQNSVCFKSDLQDDRKMYYYVSFILAPKLLTECSSAEHDCSFVLSCYQAGNQHKLPDSAMVLIATDTAGDYHFSVFKSTVK